MSYIFIYFSFPFIAKLFRFKTGKPNMLMYVTFSEIIVYLKIIYVMINITHKNIARFYTKRVYGIVNWGGSIQTCAMQNGLVLHFLFILVYTIRLNDKKVINFILTLVPLFFQNDNLKYKYISKIIKI